MASAENLRTQVAEVSAVALIWTLLFELNGWLFSVVEVNEFISWVFLPAALRVAAVLLLGWRGTLGLFIGALITNSPVFADDPLAAVALSAISAAAPLLAVELSKRWLQISADLAGLTFKQLAVIATVGAATSAVVHNVYFSLQRSSYSMTEGIVPMFGGDMLGTLLVLYVSAVVLRRLPPKRR